MEKVSDDKCDIKFGAVCCSDKCEMQCGAVCCSDKCEMQCGALCCKVDARVVRTLELLYAKKARGLRVGVRCLKGMDACFLKQMAETAELANGCEAVCIFVNDKVDAPCLEVLAQGGVKFLLLRSAGFNNVDLEVAADLGISVRRVPAYSPHAVAEMAIALLLGVVCKECLLEACIYDTLRRGAYERERVYAIAYTNTHKSHHSNKAQVPKETLAVPKDTLTTTKTGSQDPQILQPYA